MNQINQTNVNNNLTNNTNNLDDYVTTAQVIEWTEIKVAVLQNWYVRNPAVGTEKIVVSTKRNLYHKDYIRRLLIKYRNKEILDLFNHQGNLPDKPLNDRIKESKITELENERIADKNQIQLLIESLENQKQSFERERKLMTDRIDSDLEKYLDIKLQLNKSDEALRINQELIKKTQEQLSTTQEQLTKSQDTINKQVNLNTEMKTNREAIERLQLALEKNEVKTTILEVEEKPKKKLFGLF